MTLTFLGTGTSGGVPAVGCQCEVCTSKDPHDNRLRTSAMVETASTRIIIDCGPDFRQQMLRVPFRKIDAVLISHIHYDHVGGIDDLRPFCSAEYPKLLDIDIYADKPTAEALTHNMPYCFTPNSYPGIPKLQLHTLKHHVPLTIGDISVVPFWVNHGSMPITAFRIGPLAYITDMKTIDDEELKYAEGAEILVANALRFHGGHYSHQLVDDAIQLARRIGAKQTFLVHASHDMGLHEQVQKMLPQDVRMAYDNQIIQF